MSLSLAKNDVGLRLFVALLGRMESIKLDVDTSTSKSKLTLTQDNVIVGGSNIAKYLSQQNFASKWLGRSKEEEAEVDKWIQNTITSADEGSVKTLNEHLAARTYLVGNSITLADIMVYGALHPIIRDMGTKKRHSLIDVVRWFDFIQNNDQVKQQAGQVALEYIPIDQDNVPKIQRKAPEKEKKKDNNEKSAKGEIKKDEKVIEPSSTITKEKSEKKQVKVKKQPQKSTPDPSPSPPQPYMIDLRVGHIVKAEKHPDADSLYVEHIDLGEAEPRTVVSGLVKHIPLDQMQDRKVICVCNLKPVAMRGIKSYAMVLCATSNEGDKVEIIDPPKNAKAGERVWFDDFHGEPETVLNPKKKIWETVQPGFFTTENREAAYKDADGMTHLLRTETGDICSAPTVIGGSIR